MLNNPNFMTNKILMQFLQRLIPFNRPHHFSLKKISKSEVCLKIPLIRNNKNHLKGMHACAIATLGEYTAGLLLIQNFSFSRFRLILKKLQVDYHYQGRTNLHSIAKISKKELHIITKKLKNNDQVISTINCEVYDKKENHIATITTSWQLKKWAMVSTKI